MNILKSIAYDEFLTKHELNIHDEFINLLKSNELIKKYINIETVSIFENKTFNNKFYEQLCDPQQLCSILNMQFQILILNINDNLISFLFKKLETKFQVIFCNGGTGIEYHDVQDNKAYCIYEYNNINKSNIENFFKYLLVFKSKKLNINHLYFIINEYLIDNKNYNYLFSDTTSKKFNTITQKTKQCTFMAFFMLYYYLNQSINFNSFMGEIGLYSIDYVLDNNIRHDQRFYEALLEKIRYYKSLITDYRDTRIETKFFEHYRKYNQTKKILDISFSNITFDWINPERFEISFNNNPKKLNDVCILHNSLNSHYSETDIRTILTTFINSINNLELDKHYQFGDIYNDSIIESMIKLPFLLLKYLINKSIFENLSTIDDDMINDLYTTYQKWFLTAHKYRKNDVSIEIYKYAFLIIFNKLIKIHELIIDDINSNEIQIDFINNINLYPIIDGNMYAEIDFLLEQCKNKKICWFHTSDTLLRFLNLLYDKFILLSPTDKLKLTEHIKIKLNDDTHIPITINIATPDTLNITTDNDSILMGLLFPTNISDKQFNKYLMYFQILYATKFKINYDTQLTPFESIYIIPIKNDTIITCSINYNILRSFNEIQNIDITQIKNIIFNDYKESNNILFTYLQYINKFIDTNDETYITQNILIPFLAYGKQFGNHESSTYTNINLHIEHTYIQLLLNKDKIYKYFNSIDVNKISAKTYHILMCILSYFIKYDLSCYDISCYDIFIQMCNKREIYDIDTINRIQLAEEKILFASICFEICMCKNDTENAVNYLFLIQSVIKNININLYRSTQYIIPNILSHTKKIEISYKSEKYNIIFIYNKLQEQTYYHISLLEALYLQFITKYNTNILELPKNNNTFIYKYDRYVQELNIDNHILYQDRDNNIIIHQNELFKKNKLKFNWYDIFGLVDIMFMTEKFDEKFNDIYHIFKYKDDKIKLIKPYFINNMNLIAEYDWIFDNKYIGTKKNKNDHFLIDQIIINKKDDETCHVYRIRNKKTEYLCSHNNIEYDNCKIKPIFEYFSLKDDIMIWVNDNKTISCVDLMSYKLRFEWEDSGKIKINNEYELIINHSDFTINRWVVNVNNGFLVQDSKNNNYILLFGKINNDNYDIDNFFHISSLKNTKNNEILPNDDTTYRIIPIHNILHVPHIDNKDSLQLLFLSYIKSQSIGNILDIYSHFETTCYNIKGLYSGIFDYIINNIFTPHEYITLNDFSCRLFYKPSYKYIIFKIGKIYQEVAISNVSFRKELDFYNYDQVMILTDIKKEITLTQTITKINQLSYYYNFTYSEIENFNDIIKDYYFTTIKPSLTMYYFISLLQNNHLLFSIFYTRLLNKYNIDDDLRHIYHQKKKILSSNQNITINPLEFYYQSIIGYFIKPEQEELSNKIFKNVSRKYFKQIGGNLLSELINYDNIILDEHLNKSEIHSLIMGGGKTSMITPIVILKYIQCQAKLKETNHIYICLPENLVTQSNNQLTSNLAFYYPIRINEIKENRDTHNFIQSFKTYENDLNTHVYIMSDISLKCALINDHIEIKTNFNNNIYLFDEIDMIINPIISELNYPSIELEELKSYNIIFPIIFNILKEIFHVETMNNNSDLQRIIANKSSDYTLIPHFRIIDKSSDLITNIVDFIKTMINSNQLLSTNVKTIFLSDNIPLDIKNPDIDILYTLYQFINVLPTILTLTNRANYGITEKSDIIIPFAYVETPVEGSQFSNPILILSLTIIEYLVQVKKFSKNTSNKILNVIKEKYMSISSELRPYSEIYNAFNTLKINKTLDEIIDISQLDKKISDFNTTLVFIEEYCNSICKTIKITKDQLNVAGIDLIMSFNFKNKSGFTGTPIIPKFYDFDTKDDDSNQMTISKSTDIIDDTIKNIIINSTISSIKTYDISDNMSKKEYLQQILDDNRDAKVLIDIGQELVGLTYNDIFELLVTRDDLENFVYWNNLHEPMSKNFKTKHEITWDKLPNSNIFYYYDNQHTTGIDAKIPTDYIGLALLGSNSIYRDVVQGIYRMRRLGDNQKIRFIITKKLETYIRSKVHEITLENLFNWFKQEETDDNTHKQKLMNLQNLRALFKNFKFASTLDDNVIIQEKSKNPFYVRNNFYYPLSSNRELIICKKTNNHIEVECMERIFNANHKIHLWNLLQNIDLNIIQTNRQEIKEQQLNVQIQMQLSINTMFKQYENQSSINTLDTIPNYINHDVKYYSEFNKSRIYISKNFDSNIPYKYPYFVLCNNKAIFVIPFIEGIKILDSVTRKMSIPDNFSIYDLLGTKYYSNSEPTPNIITLIRLYMLIENPKEYISLQDLKNILYTKQSTLNIIKTIVSTQNKTHLKPFFDCLKNYRTELSKYIIQFNTFREKRLGISCIPFITSVLSTIRNFDDKQTIKCILEYLTANNHCININGDENVGLDD